MTIIPVDAKTAEKLYFERSGVIAFFEKQKYRVHMWVGITLNSLRPTVSVFDTGAGPNPTRTFSHPVSGATAFAQSTTRLCSLF